MKESSDISQNIMQTAEQVFGITAVKPHQLLVMQKIMEQAENFSLPARGQIVILPTGTGKSLCFQLPAVLLGKTRKSVIIYPLLALMTDQILFLKKHKIDCCILKGGQTGAERNAELAKLRNGTGIIITNPETLIQPGLLEKLKRFEFELFIVDEAHVIYQWGLDFRPAYKALNSAVKKLKPHQTLAFTATATNETIQTIKKVLFPSPANPVTLHADPDRENIIFRAYPAVDRTSAVLTILRHCKKPAVIFCPERKITEVLALRIQETFHKDNIRYYHAGLSSEVRSATEKWFLDSEDGILTATSAYGMGINKPNIRTTIHYRLPQTASEFIQEAGRAGRDGQNSESWAIVCDKEKQSKNSLAGVFTGNECRRCALLALLDFEKTECSGCDVCLGEKIEVSYEETIIKKLIKKYPFTFSLQSASHFLHGSPAIWECSQAMQLSGLFGSLSYLNETEIANAVSNMNPGSVPSFKNIKLLYFKDNFIYNSIAFLYGGIVRGLQTFLRRKRRHNSNRSQIQGT